MICKAVASDSRGNIFSFHSRSLYLLPLFKNYRNKKIFPRYTAPSLDTRLLSLYATLPGIHAARKEAERIGIRHVGKGEGVKKKRVTKVR